MIISLAVDSDLAAKFLLILTSDEGLDGLDGEGQGEGNLTEGLGGREGEKQGEGNLTEHLEDVLSLATFPQFPVS